jgi:dihydropteroate synthase
MTTPAFTYRFGPRAYDLGSRTFLMGVLNVTPDSFSDGGRYADAESAVRHGLRMVAEGADFIDVGGESSRPGAEPVPADEELRRVLPVITRLRAETSVPISIDTTKPEVAGPALDAGAVIVNDITGLASGPALADVAARSGASMVLMHMKGTPKTMQEAPVYADVMGEIAASLERGVALARSRGVEQVIVDPGIGFGKLLAHNLEILRSLRALDRLGCPILVGPSRKSFLGQITGLEAGERLHATAGAVAVAAMQGAHIVRVHDVREMRQVAQVVDAVLQPTR